MQKNDRLVETMWSAKAFSTSAPREYCSIRVLEKCGFQEDSEAIETMFLPNLNKGKGEHVEMVRLSRSLSFSVPPPTFLTWED